MFTSDPAFEFQELQALREEVTTLKTLMEANETSFEILGYYRKGNYTVVKIRYNDTLTRILVIEDTWENIREMKALSPYFHKNAKLVAEVAPDALQFMHEIL